MRFPWRIYGLVGLVLLIICLLFTVSYNQAIQIHRMNSPVLHIVHELHLEANTAQMWVEEALDGEIPYDSEGAWGHLELRIKKAGSLLQTSKSGDAIPAPSLKKKFSECIEKLKSDTQELKQRVETRLLVLPAGTPDHGNPDIRQSFDTLNQTLLEMEQFLLSNLGENVAGLRRIYIIIIAVFFGAALVSVFILQRYERRRANDYLALAQANARLHSEVEERRKTEMQLKNIRAELENTVLERTRELMDTNQKLHSEVAERRKYEQELIAHQDRLRKLSSQLARSEEQVRRKIATDIHDRIGQNLAVSKIKLGALYHALQSDQLMRQVDEIRKMMDLTIEDTRSLTFEISPPILYELGLDAALEWLVEMYSAKHGLPIKLELESDGMDLELELECQTFLYRAANELILNIFKHARATSVSVAFQMQPNAFVLKVMDDGVGFNPDQNQSYPNQGFGLFSLREEAKDYSGIFEIDSGIGVGTRVTLSLPKKYCQ